MIYQRIMIFGLPGSGKSTLAVHLAHLLKLPLHHLDKHFFIGNWVERDREEFLNFQQNLVNQGRWIIDGNAIRSLEMRYSRADLVLYFCASRPICFGRLIKRRFFKDKSIKDRAEGCRERLPTHLIKYMWTFDRRFQPLLMRLQETYPNVPFYKIRTSQDLEEVMKLF
ncbi:MAG TPA: DNA topology modulation protein [Alphaproteobacteria bacterium]|nr:DNA topology modulation protein [Alphaproteobacteria bacterium]